MNELTAEHFDRIESAFHAALDSPLARRPSVIRRQLADLPQLIPAVLRLLEAHAHGSGFQQAACSLDILDSGSGTGSVPAAGLAPGTRIGNWRIERLIARGGMSSVYLAERTTPGLSQCVALKLIAADADAVRFAIERRILASLEHPGIARLIDGGVNEDARPWLASEYVDGRNITEYCVHHALSVRQRINLLIEVALATAYAHAHLVVHRDIKPANILVTPEGHAKLVDFGIAKLLYTEGTAATRTGNALMTPQYAAPEQILGAAITAQTDVHALGVLACQLLTGRNPFAEPGDSMLKATRAIVETVPPLPSSLCADPQLGRQLRGDLDAIILKALRKEPDGRYASAERFAEDLQNYLAGDVVAARRGSRAYRMRSTLRRHRWAFAAALAFVAILIGAFSWRITQLTAERDRANSVAEFLDGLITGLDPGVRSSTDASRVTIAEVLDIGRSRLLQSSLPDPLRAQLLTRIAEGYNGLVEWPKAAEAARDALTLDTLGDWPSNGLYDTKLALATALVGQNDYIEANRIYLELPGVSGASTHQRARRDAGYGALLIATGHLREAVVELQHAIDALQATADVEPRITALNQLATAQWQLGENDAALASSREVLELTGEHFPKNEIWLGMAEANYGSRLRASDPARAEPYLETALQRFRRVLGDDHPNTVNAENNYALLLQDLQRDAEAEALIRSNIEHRASLYGRDSREVGEAWQNLAAILFYRGSYSESIVAGQEALSILQAALPTGHYLRAFPMLTIAGAQIASDQPKAARTTLRRANALLEPALPVDSLPRKVVRARDAMALAAIGPCEEALPLLAKASDDLGEANRVRYADEFDRALAHCPPAASP